MLVEGFMEEEAFEVGLKGCVEAGTGTTGHNYTYISQPDRYLPLSLLGLVGPIMRPLMSPLICSHAYANEEEGR